MASDPNEEPDSDAEDEALKAEGKLKIIVEHNEDSTVFVVKQTTLASKVMAGAAKKYGLDPNLVRVVRIDGAGRLDKDKSMKVNGLEAGQTYRFSVVTEQVGGKHRR